MTEEEILNKYKDLINEDIEEYCKEYGLTDSPKKKAFTVKYIK